LINHVPAKRFINPGGPPLFKLQKIGQRGLINTAGIINPNLTLVQKAFCLGFITFFRLGKKNNVISYKIKTNAVNHVPNTAMDIHGGCSITTFDYKGVVITSQQLASHGV